MMSQIRKLVGYLAHAPYLNPIILNGLYWSGLRNHWIKAHFNRVGSFSRDGLSMVGQLWEPVANDIFWGGKYGFESEMSVLFEQDVTERSTVLDIGAYTGYYSLISAKKGAKVYAFEPSQATRRLLIQNLALNKAAVAVIPLALSDQSSFADLYTPSGETDSGSSLDGKYGGNRERVRLVTLDDFVEFYGLTSIDVVKLDVERHEAQVLRGGAKSLSRFRPIVYVEVLPDTDTVLIEACLPGYKFEKLTDQGPVKETSLKADRAWRNYRCSPA